MRTTVELPEGLLRRAKARAALRGLSFKDYLQEALTRRLEDEEQIPQSSQRVALPIVRSARPGSIKVTSEQIQNILTGEDAAGH